MPPVHTQATHSNQRLINYRKNFKQVVFAFDKKMFMKMKVVFTIALLFVGKYDIFILKPYEVVTGEKTRNNT